MLQNFTNSDPSYIAVASLYSLPVRNMRNLSNSIIHLSVRYTNAETFTINHLVQQCIKKYNTSVWPVADQNTYRPTLPNALYLFSFLIRVHSNGEQRSRFISFYAYLSPIHRINCIKSCSKEN